MSDVVRSRRALVLRLLVGDVVALSLAAAAAYLIRFGTASARVAQLTSFHYVAVAALFVLTWVVVLAVLNGYEPLAIGSTRGGVRKVIPSAFGVLSMVGLVSLIGDVRFSREFFGWAFLFSTLVLFVWRLLFKAMLVRSRREGKFCELSVAIGDHEDIDLLVRRLNASPASGYLVTAVATGGAPGTMRLPGGRVVPDVGTLADAVGLAERGEVSSIIVVDDSLHRRDLRRLGWALEDTPVHLVVTSRLTDVAGPRIHWQPVEGLPLMSVEMPTYSGGKYRIKRAFDIVVAGLATVLVSPVLGVVALAVKLGDGGPVLFRQTRVGVNGTEFAMLKFRSMVEDAEQKLGDLAVHNEGNGVLFKIKDDPRITRVGRFIRRYSIDELPQLFNVLKGDMSLVGPRPPLPSEVAEYEAHVHRRLNVKPGITGPWQVSGRSNLSWEDSVRKDLYYVENWSLSGDIAILIATVRVVMSREGAY